MASSEHITHKKGGVTVRYFRNDTKDQRVVDKLIAWYKRHGFSGEGLQQSDSAQETAVELLGEIADDIMQFDVQ